MPRAVKVKKAQADGRYRVRRAGDSRVQLAGCLVSAIRAEWGDWSVFAYRYCGTIPVHRRRRSVDDGNSAVAPGLVKDVEGAGEIDLVRPLPIPVGKHDGGDRGEVKACIDAL